MTRKPGYVPTMRQLRRAAARNRQGTRYWTKMNYQGRHSSSETSPRTSLASSMMSALRQLARAIMALKRARVALTRPPAPAPSVHETHSALAGPTLKSAKLAGRHRAPRSRTRSVVAHTMRTAPRSSTPARLPKRLRRQLDLLEWCERHGQPTYIRHVHPDDARGKRALPKWSFA